MHCVHRRAIILSMEIKSTLINPDGQTLPITYRDLDSLDELNGSKVKGVHAFCFCGDKIVIVYSEAKGHWGPPGGAVELGETAEEATVREVFEETNMRTLKQKLVGYLEAFEPEKTVQTRSVCIVEPIGPFIADAAPEGDVTEIKLIDPQDYKQYFDWGIVGDHIMERALQIKEQMDSGISGSLDKQ
jgi:ADP-ribose pyrophosphatase YjhB (NUDIX family)